MEVAGCSIRGASEIAMAGGGGGAFAFFRRAILPGRLGVLVAIEDLYMELQKKVFLEALLLPAILPSGDKPFYNYKRIDITVVHSHLIFIVPGDFCAPSRNWDYRL